MSATTALETRSLTREEAFALCDSESYVEYYGGLWMVVPYAPVVQPEFFNCQPR